MRGPLRADRARVRHDYGNVDKKVEQDIENGPMGIDAITRIVGFFVSAMGVALIFDGVIEALETHGVTTLH